MLRLLRSFLCGLRGHEEYMMFDRPNAVYLWCPNCGYETEGWTVEVGSRYATDKEAREAGQRMVKKHRKALEKLSNA